MDSELVARQSKNRIIRPERFDSASALGQAPTSMRPKEVVGYRVGQTQDGEMIVIDGESIDKPIVGGDEINSVGRTIRLKVSKGISKQADIVNDVWNILYEGIRGDESGNE